MRKITTILFMLMAISSFSQSIYDHQGKIRMRYNNGGTPDTLLIQFSGDSVLYDANNPFHKFAGGVIMDSIKLNGAWETSFVGSQWTTSGSNIYYNTGNVGINNASPSYKLDVGGLIGGSNIETNTTSQSTRLGYETGINENETAIRKNTLIGYQSGYTLTTGVSNTFIGFRSGYTLTTGVSNTFVGDESGYFNNGNGNTFVGRQAGQKNTSGQYNTNIGAGAGRENTTSAYNSNLGFEAGINSITGSYNTVFGSFSSYSNRYGSRNVIIGFNARYYGVNFSDELVIDNQGRGGSANDSLLYRRTSLLYGKFSTDTLNQELDINGRLRYTATTAEIYRHVDSTARTQSIPTGTTPTKIVVFSDNGVSSHCTADAANDKITITKPGIYDVKLFISYSSGTNNVNWFARLFLGGSAVPNIHSQGNTSNANQFRSTALGGKIRVTTVPIDIDYRVFHDYPSAVNLTFISANLNINYEGE